MFTKCVLRTEQTGVRYAQAYAWAENRLERWAHGDKLGLWREVAKEDFRTKRKKSKKGGIKEAARNERVNK